MGCGASKQATSAVANHNRGAPVLDKGASNSTTATTPASHSDHKNNGTTKTVITAPPTPAAADAAAHTLRSSLVNPAREQWAVRPGYSSGASSYAGSETDGDDDRAAFLLDGGPPPSASNHSDILALSTLRQEMQAEGDLAKTMVRIETPFDTPIEEIYNGVLDGKVLGSGISGIVREVTHIVTGIKYAVKVLDLGLINTMEGLRQLRDEIRIMCQLDHPNIVRIEEVYESANEIYIVQELCTGGDLFDRLEDQPDYHYTEAQCARLVKQMLSALRYLHSKGIIHRDLKLENFLFSSAKPDSELKMIDFGLSKHFEVGELLCDKVGTPYTVAPEIIKGNYDEKTDLWALGVITFLLLCGDPPFGGLDGESLLQLKENILRAEIVFEPQETWRNVSVEGKRFIKMLLNPDPTKRPTAKEAQKSEWIQVWAKKDAEEGALLNKTTVGALIAFKESSDMQKLLSEVLSFTLMPEQIVELRREFEIMDTDGDGEISLMSLKKVLMQNAEAGSLGALTEKEVEDIFDSIRVRKSEPTIRWHEFLAAGLSQARVDDRNLRLAFDRLDIQRKGFITFDDLVDILGNGGGESESLEKIWLESLEDLQLDRITFDDFKKLMKGQPKQDLLLAPSTPNSMKPLKTVPEDNGLHAIPSGSALDSMVAPSDTLLDDVDNPRLLFGKGRSMSYEQEKGSWRELVHGSGSGSGSFSRPEAKKEASLALLLSSQSDSANSDASMTPLTANRALYRKHREMRLAVLDASKQFDKKRNDIQNRTHPTHAGLIMRRGVVPPVELEDSHARALFESAARRCGREPRRTRNKTVSDVTGMLMKAAAAENQK